MSKKQIRPLTGRMIDAMTDAQRAKLIEDLESKTPEQNLAESRPLTRAQRERWQERARIGRPVVGKGAKPVAVTIERGLLKRADAYAKSHGMKRAQLIAHALKMVMGEATGPPRDAA
jgi:hypothetical protein